jgi:glucose/mannose-6-phosphate isomerase
MIDFNDLDAMQKLDPNNFITQINNIPDQMEQAWNLGLALPMPAIDGVKHILLCGMGSSALSADLLAAYAAARCPVPLLVHRDDDLPAWAGGPDTLVIAVSYSGSTEETLSAFEQAQSRGCHVLAVTGGGRLAAVALERGLPLWQLEPAGQPRTAAAILFALLLAVLYRMGLLDGANDALTEALHALRNAQTNLRAEAPVAFNPAKRLAGQLVGRWVVVLAADILAPVARRWKQQLAESGKAWAQFEFLPEANHHSIAGLNHPENALLQTIALFLTAPSNLERNRQRLNLTRQVFMTQGVNTDAITARGEGPLAHILTMLLFGEYTAYYLAMAYGEDPSQLEIIDLYKQALDEGR